MGDTGRRNVYVVGAGASTDFGLPTGSVLKDEIAGICSFNRDDLGVPRGGSKTLVRAIGSLVSRGMSSPEAFFQAGENLARSMPAAPSIDNYLNTYSSHLDILMIGKMAIIESIAASERVSRLMV